MPAYPPPDAPALVAPPEPDMAMPTVIPPDQMPDWPKPPPPVEG